MTGPDYLHIKDETLEQAKVDLATAYAAAKNAIDELRSILDGKLVDWTGDAKDAYRQVKGDWDKAFDHMNGVLQRAHVHVGNAQQMYQEVERQNVSIWHS